MRISDWSSDVCSSDLKTPRIDDYKARYERPKPCQPVLAIDAVKTRTTLPGALHPLCRAQTQCRPRRDLVFRYRHASRGFRRHMAAVKIERASCRERGGGCVTLLGDGEYYHKHQYK